MLEHDHHVALDVLEHILSISPKSTSHSQRLALANPGTEWGEGLRTGLILLQSGAFELCDLGDVEEAHFFVSDSVIQSCFHVRFGEHITAAELGLLKTLMCGGSLRTASEEDGRSYTTKRNQMAALREKSGVSSQAELLQLMSVILTSVARTAEESRNEHVDRLQSLMDEYYGPLARLHRTSFSNGRQLLVADIGPLDGQACLLMSPSVETLVPLPTRIDFLEVANVRVLIPIRPGFFGQELDKDNPHNTLNSFVEDCEMFLTSFDLASLPIISVTAGALSAMLLAEKLGDRCKQLVMCSPQYFCRTKGDWKSSYSGNWAHMLSRFHRLLGPVLSTLTPFLVNKAFAKNVWLKAYEDSPDDVEQILALDKEEWVPTFVEVMMQCNLNGIEADLILMRQDWLDLASDLKCKTKIYYGETDPFSDHAFTVPRLRAAGIEVNVVPGYGQNSFIARPEVLFGYLGRWSA